jgi:glycosyltransferase involved in cell wall biosynthesis
MVREAIQAALAQTRVPDEVVVFDDASTDSTWDVLQELARQNPRVKVFRQSCNTGGVENWNAAMAATSGEFIAWCSDDDRFEQGHLEASIHYLMANPDVGLVHSGFIDCIEADGCSQEIAYRPLRSNAPLQVDRGDLFWFLTRYYNWPFHPSTIVMRRAVWEAVGSFDAKYALADTDWFVRAAERFRVVLLPRWGVDNRRHSGNWSNQVGSARMQAEIFEIVERAMDRRWPRTMIEKTMWRAVWRSNIRLHLLLTMLARLRSGHANAAVDAWKVLANETGWRLPWWLVRAGECSIRYLTKSLNPTRRAVRAQVSPL